MKMISPSNVEVDIGQTLKPGEYIGMCRREVLDGFLRDRAEKLGAKLINGTVHKLEMPGLNTTDPYVLHYADHSNGSLEGEAKTLKVDLVIGADGANSRVAKAMDAGDYNYAIAFQERIALPEDKMAYYHSLAEMYVGDDVSTDFYAWVFPKYDHVAVGTGTMKVHKASIKQLQAGIRKRAAKKLEGGTIIKVEAHPIPEHPRVRSSAMQRVMSLSLRVKASTLLPNLAGCAPKSSSNAPSKVPKSPPKPISKHISRSGIKLMA
jgi:geranylgeranyl diphosphate/geranylgeranyl-bacteriochlorophyllide a reductase